MKKVLLLGLLILAWMPFMSRAQGPTLGILGDSDSDEYRSNDCRACGSGYEATTLNWLELLVAHRGVDAGPWGTWNDSRRSGREFNFALSGSQACDTVGQAQGLATQGVQYAVILTGANDFNSWNGTYDQVYNSPDFPQVKVDSIVGCIAQDVALLQGAGVAHIILVSFTDPGSFPQFIVQYPDASKRARVTAAINAINSQLANFSGVHYVDTAALVASLLGSIDGAGFYHIAGEAIDAVNRGDEPHHLQLDDNGVGHAGTVFNGLIANFLLQALNAEGFGVTPFSDNEIVANAGIVTAQPTNTPTRTNTPLPTLTYTSSPTQTASNTPVFTNTPSPTFTPTFTRTPTRTLTATPTVVTHTIQFVNKPNNSADKYSVLDGIVEDSVFREVDNPPVHFSLSFGWMYFSNGGRNNSPAWTASMNNQTATFITTASVLVIQSAKRAQFGSFQVKVDGVVRVTYNANSGSSTPTFVDVNVPLG